MDTTNPVETINRIMTNVYRLSACLGSTSENILQECCGFGLSQFRILWALQTHQEGVQQNAIAKWMKLTEAAVSRQLQIMRDKGLLTVEVDTDDRRSRTVMLTPAGREFTQNGISKIVEELAPAFAGLSAEEQQMLSDLLDKLFYRVTDGMSGK